MIIRLAAQNDAADMAAVLNAIIAKGGTTAHEQPFDIDKMRTGYITPPHGIACHVAERDGRVVGFQSLAWPKDADDPFPPSWAVIATFVADGQQGHGIGQALFAATRAAALAANVATIDATIRADNTGGLRYYSGLGFADYAVLRDIPLRSGARVDRIRKRFDTAAIPT